MTTNSVDDAIARLQVLAKRCATVKVRGAPDYPVEDAGVLPLSIAYAASGQVSADEATTAMFNPVVINVDFHFSRVSLKQAFQQSDAIIIEYGRLLCGDPTLGGAVDTIMFPVNYSVFPNQWDKVTTHLLQFSIPVKIFETPQAST